MQLVNLYKGMQILSLMLVCLWFLIFVESACEETPPLRFCIKRFNGAIVIVEYLFRPLIRLLNVFQNANHILSFHVSMLIESLSNLLNKGYIRGVALLLPYYLRLLIIL